MANQSLGLSEKLHHYLLSVSLREPDLFARLRAETARGNRSSMQMSPEAGQFLAFLIKLTGAKRAIEIGVFTGYSALWVASALPGDGQLIACDVNEKWTATAQQFWKEAGVDRKISLRLAPASETMQELLDDGQQNSFDFALIDADKANYNTYYEQCMQLIRTGGLIAVDNVLWHGRVLDDTRQDDDTNAIREINQNLGRDERVDISLVPIGDGVTLLRKRESY